MSFSVSGLSAYTDEQKLPLILKAQLGAKSVSLFEIAPGIKSAQKLNLMDTDAVFQANSCGFNASGTTTLSQRTLTVGDIKINETLCPKDLAAKWTQTQLKAGARGEKEVLPFEKEYTELKAAKIASQIETAVWQGDTESETNNLSYFDGLIKIIDAAATAVDGNTTSATEITSSNANAIMQAIYAVIPIEILDKPDTVIMCGWDTFRKWTMNLTTLNLFHYTGDTSNGELVLPGTNIKVIALNGLNSTNRIFAGQLSNFYFGCDLLDDSERFEIFFAKEADSIRFIAEFRAGTQVAYPAQIVEFTLVEES
jgi:hypothetical protein